MSWRDRLLPASFRGVPFHVDAVDYVTSRRNAIHQFIGHDRPAVEELGRGPRRFQVQGYLVSGASSGAGRASADNYDLDRDRLLRALERGGAGDLEIHTYGKQRVFVDGQVRFSERRLEGGYVEFSVDFVEWNISLAEVEAAPSRFRVIDSTSRVFGIVGKPLTLLEKARGAVAAARKAVASVVGRLMAIVRTARELQQLADDILELVQFAVDGVLDLLEVFDLIDQTISSFERAYAGYRILFRLEAEEFAGDGYVSRHRRATARSLTQSIRAGAVAKFAAKAVQESYETRDKAEARVAEITGMVETLSAEQGIHPQLVVELRQLRGAAETYLRQVSLGLPILAEIHVHRSTSLQLSYRVFGDLSQRQAIIDRNRISNPLLIAGPVEVRASA